MSYTTKVPSIAKSTSGLPTDVEDGTTAYDTTQNTLVVRVGGAWEKAGGAGATTPTVVYDDGAAVGNTDQIQGDIPYRWMYVDLSLKGLVIGTSCTTIGDGAFDRCTGLTGSLVIPNSVTSIGNAAFRECSGFTGSLTIPNSVASILDVAFRDCTGLTSLTIGSSVTSIGASAFYNCTGLTGSLIIPNNVTSIGAFAFWNCTGLTNVDCYVEKSVLDVTSSLASSGVTTIHVRSTDNTWTAGAGQTIGGKTGIEVIKDL